MPVWPSTLPQRPQQAGWSRSERFQQTLTEMDDGPVGSRRWSRIKAFRESVTWMMSEAQVAEFDEFFEDDLEGGTLRFEMAVDWAGYTNQTCACHFEGRKPEIRNAGGGWYLVSGNLTVYP
jgi:hypothetical protein